MDFNYLLHTPLFTAFKQEKTLFFFLAFALHPHGSALPLASHELVWFVAYPDSCTAKGEVSRFNTLKVKINNDEIFPVIPSEFMQTTIAGHFFLCYLFIVR